MDIVYILLDLYLFHVFGAIINGILFKILRLLLIYRGTIDFYKLTLYSKTLL